MEVPSCAINNEEYRLEEQTRSESVAVADTSDGWRSDWRMFQEVLPKTGSINFVYVYLQMSNYAIHFCVSSRGVKN